MHPTPVLRRSTATLAGGLFLILPIAAQEGGQLHGSFSSDVQYYREDSVINAVVPPEKLAAMGWMNLIYTYKNFEIGGRFEAYEPALEGYPGNANAYQGSGIGYRYAKYTLDDLEVTMGNFFEQFGQGLVFRSYEERYLGVDNAMDGIRVKYKPYRGIYLKGLVGGQRFGFNNGFTKGPGIVRGADAEISLAELLDTNWTSLNNLTVGGSFVSRYQSDTDPLYVLPENVGAWAVRANYTTPKFNLYSEYAYKINDPNVQNGFIYKPGQALMFIGTYSVKGFGVTAGAHSYDNMFFQSDRAAPTGFDLNINFLPPLAKQHTYNLPATLYPYATQPNGEVSYQGEVFYKWKKGTPIGGRYGTAIAVNYSLAYSLDTTRLSAADDAGRLGYTTNSIFQPGDRRYFQDINVELRKKISSSWTLALSYINLEYDQATIEGKPGKPMVYADMFILEGLHNFNDRNSLRFEVQHLSTGQDRGNWFTALAEFTFSPHWFIAVMDQYNYQGFEYISLDVTDREQVHYPVSSVGFIKGGNRFQINYGRQREGIFCVGGICRPVPATSGLALSITSTF